MSDHFRDTRHPKVGMTVTCDRSPTRARKVEIELGVSSLQPWGERFLAAVFAAQMIRTRFKDF
jgi:hypothetical protein